MKQRIRGSLINCLADDTNKMQLILSRIQKTSRQLVVPFGDGELISMCVFLASVILTLHAIAASLSNFTYQVCGSCSSTWSTLILKMKCNLKICGDKSSEVASMCTAEVNRKPSDPVLEFLQRIYPHCNLLTHVSHSQRPPYRESGGSEAPECTHLSSCIRPCTCSRDSDFNDWSKTCVHYSLLPLTELRLHHINRHINFCGGSSSELLLLGLAVFLCNLEWVVKLLKPLWSHVLTLSETFPIILGCLYL